MDFNNFRINKLLKFWQDSRPRGNDAVWQHPRFAEVSACRANGGTDIFVPFRRVPPNKTLQGAGDSRPRGNDVARTNPVAFQSCGLLVRLRQYVNIRKMFTI
ncbi:hypothetical protein [Neisseria bacilliformis]|uniref:hypothetical protein n=1 Tax=Neisseria bacilliformis TaxID=267212 RepID=UPI00128E8813|nr:hypothetical protein [Neisseria bacilliformis]